MAGASTLLGDFLVANNLISKEQLKEALQQQKCGRKLLGRTLIEMGFIEESEMIQALGEYLDIKKITLKNYHIPRSLIQLIPEEIARKYILLPLFQVHNILTLAMTDPMDLAAIDAVSRETLLKVEPVVCDKDEIVEAIDFYYSRTKHTVQKAERIRRERTGTNNKSDSPVSNDIHREETVDWLNTIIRAAFHEKVNLIHLDASQDSFIVYFQYDSDLKDKFRPPLSIKSATIRRLAWLAGFSVNHFSRTSPPVNGWFKTNIDGYDLFIQLSIFHTITGERVILSISPKDKASDIRELGLSSAIQKNAIALLSSGKGFFWLNGPSGSGKTATLYALLRALPLTGRRALVFERIIPYHVEQLQQIQAESSTIHQYYPLIESVSIYNPAVIALNGFADEKTIRAALNAVMNGRLVILVTQYDTSAEAVYYLSTHSELRHFLIYHSSAMLIQRLLPSICQHCRTAEQLKPEMTSKLGLKAEDTSFAGKGCKKCGYSGLMGTTPLYEWLDFTKEFKNDLRNISDINQLNNIVSNYNQ
ncbi:Flp pilus assembly complex ATPase component TadA [candidate division KSB1 bacterium]|nr:Flp pilus assembly complex ATPase component TadA [candidate division KSB1 bacterium]